jgi:hypothetical protein
MDRYRICEPSADDGRKPTPRETDMDDRYALAIIALELIS